jgi:large subunit ribosomal protein L4
MARCRDLQAHTSLWKNQGDNHMASIDIKNLKNEVVGKLDLADSVFGGPINQGLMHLAVKQYLSSLRSGTHKTKTRAEVQGSGKKPWRQKGTGRARVGEIRNPLWRKGGTVFGPQPRDYEYRLPRKMFRAALKSALALKLKDNQLNVVDTLALDGHKTKAFMTALTGMGFDRKILVVDNSENPKLRLASRNLSDVQLIPNLQVTPYHVLNARHVVFTRAAIEALQEVLSK